MSTIEKKSIPSKFLLSPVKIYFLTVGPNNFGNKIPFFHRCTAGTQHRKKMNHASCSDRELLYALGS